MGPFERTVATTYTARIDNYLRGVKTMKSATEDFGKTVSQSATKNKADWDKIGSSALIAGAALAAVPAAAAVTAAKFEKSMSGVKAALDDGTRSTAQMAEQQKALSEAAIQAGQDTVFSAMEAAQAEGELARAGVDVADILGGALKGALDLAAAGQVSLATSAETVATAMNQFKLAGDEATRVADTLTAGANKSAAGVEDMAQALAQGGGVAAAFHLSIEDTVGALALFADNSLKGSDAGTSFRTMLNRLNPQTEEAQTAMEELGLKFYDQQGAFVGLEEVARQLHGALGDATDAERNLAVQTIFGQDAQRGANILIDQGAEGLQEYVKGVTDVGAAQRAAAIQTDNLIGDVERLKGTLETTFIKAGSGSSDALRSITQDVTGVIDLFNGLPESVQGTTVEFIALAAAALLVSGGAIKATTSIVALKTSMDAATVSGARLATTLKLIGGVTIVAGIALAAGEIGKLIGASQVADVKVEDLAKSIGQLNEAGRATGELADIFRQGSIFGDEEWVTSAEAIERFSIRAKNALGEDLTFRIRRAQDFGASGEKYAETVRLMDGALAEMVRNGNGKQATETLTTLLKGIGDTKVADRARQDFTQYQAALDGVALSQDAVGTSAKEVSPNIAAVTKATEDAAQAAEDAKKATDDYLDSLVQAGLVVLDRREAQRALNQSLRDLKELEDKEVKNKGEKQQKHRDEIELLDKIARQHLAVSQAVYDETGSEDDFRASQIKGHDALQKTAEKLLGSKKAAKEFADAIIKIPPKKVVTVSTNLDDETEAAKNFQRHINALHGKDVNINVRYNAGRLPNGGRDLTGGITKAEGGPIWGAGTATSDSIAAWLSNGEYVIKAAAVAKYGVHFFDRLNSMRLAGGGPVYQGATPAQGLAMSGPTSYSSTHDARLMAEVVNIMTNDAGSFQRDFRRQAPYRAKARPR